MYLKTQQESKILTDAMETQPGPRREDEYESPGFENPSPERVQSIATDPSTCCFGFEDTFKISPDVMVRFGRYSTITEAKQMEFVARNTTGFPIPRVLGYYRYGPLATYSKKDGDLFDTYIFMSFIEGENLRHKWESCSDAAKADIAAQLRDHIDQMRKIPSPNYIGSVPGGIVTDDIFDKASIRGPFESVSSFNVALVHLVEKANPGAHMGNFLSGMLSQKSHKILFAYGGGLEPVNIIVKRGRIVGILDWRFSGWYPEYWDFATTYHQGEWTSDWMDYLPRILDPYYLEYGAYCFLNKSIMNTELGPDGGDC